MPSPSRQPAAKAHPDGYAETLIAASRARGLRKAERTRLRLIAAAAGLLETLPYRDLTVAAVVGQAGLAHGTFYLYFADLGDLVRALAADFATYIHDRLAAVGDGAPGSLTRVRAATYCYAKLFRANPGLMRCMVQAGDDLPDFAATYQALNRTWNGRVARAIDRQRGVVTDGGRESQDSLMTAYALDGMVDEFLMQIYARRDPALAHLADHPDRIADLLATLWFRAAADPATGDGR